MRNVEIKARVLDKEQIEAKAKLLSKSEATLIKQHDTFFKSSTGRLKMRRFENGSGELIHYDRPDTEGPKLSDFVKAPIGKDELQGLIEVLKKSNGIIGVVEKLRLLYIVGQTRVHIDTVNGLGDFMELEEKPAGFSEEPISYGLRNSSLNNPAEFNLGDSNPPRFFSPRHESVVLNDEQSLEDGQKIADELMAQLGVRKDDLIACAYLDMLIKVNPSNGS